MDRNAIKDLYVHVFKGTSPSPTEFSVKDIKETLRKEFLALAPDRLTYEQNKYTIFQIMQEAFDEVLPDYVGNFMGQFAELKTVPKNQKATFRVKRGRRRAKTFITEVGLSGVYEAFRLDVDTFEVGAKAYGGAAYIDFERLTTGDEDLAEPMQLLLDGLEEVIYKEMLKALIAAVTNSDMPAANKVSTSSFAPDEMAKLVNIAKSYGNGKAVIFATPEFVDAMGPDAIGMPIYGLGPVVGGVQQNPGVPGNAGYATPIYSPKDIADIAATGYITMFRGTPIVQLPQGFVDENNDTYQVPPSYAYIFPAGDEKVVKVVFEGDTQVDDFKHRDRSMELEVYKRFGIAILTTNNWCCYQNTALTGPKYQTLNYFTGKKNPHNFA